MKAYRFVRGFVATEKPGVFRGSSLSSDQAMLYDTALQARMLALQLLTLNPGLAYARVYALTPRSEADPRPFWKPEILVERGWPFQVSGSSPLLRSILWGLLTVLVLVSCTPAIIGVSAALGGASVAVTYQITDKGCDAGRPAPAPPSQASNERGGSASK